MASELPAFKGSSHGVQGDPWGNAEPAKETALWKTHADEEICRVCSSLSIEDKSEYKVCLKCGLVQ